jgi:hypothetical protein
MIFEGLPLTPNFDLDSYLQIFSGESFRGNLLNVETLDPIVISTFKASHHFFLTCQIKRIAPKFLPEIQSLTASP